MVKYTPQEVIAKSIYLIDDTDTLFQLIVAVEYYCPCDKILKNIKYNVLLFSTLVQCEMAVECSFRNYIYPFLLLVKNSSSLVQNFFIHLAGFRIWHWNASGPEIGRRHFGQAVFNMTENIFLLSKAVNDLCLLEDINRIFLSIKCVNVPK